MRTSTLEELYRRLDTRLLKIENTILNRKDILTINQAKKRDYIVRTKYYGKITDANIKKDFKKEIETTIGDIFDSVTNKILNYEFLEEVRKYKETLLDIYSEILEKYDYKQIVLDTYK